MVRWTDLEGMASDKRQACLRLEWPGGEDRFTEHAVIVCFPMSGVSFGTVEERHAVRALEKQLINAIESAAVGELDGHEYGGGEVVLYASGPDAPRLFAAMEPYLRAVPAKPAHAVLRFGEANDPTVMERRVDL
jgi:hypothetical protein